MLTIRIILLNALFVFGYILLLPEHPVTFFIFSVLVISLAVVQVRRFEKQQQKILNTITSGLRNLQDGDFSISLSHETGDEANKPQEHQLVSLFNQVTDKLREEKQTLYQRELLLDKVVNASDVVTVLVNQRNTIIFANNAAKRLFNTNALLGQDLFSVICKKVPSLEPHIKKNNAIIELTIEPKQNSGTDMLEEQRWHLSRHQLKLHGSRHHLFLLKPLTKELNQQELQTWKKVIRVINHELNNSIAPISTMCHSGKILADRMDEPKLNRVFNTIASRVQKLSSFIQNYSQLAKLSTPKYSSFNINETLEQLSELYQISVNSQYSETIVNADCSQIEQLLINLLKNAKEASKGKTSEVILKKDSAFLNITIRDFGPGMEVEVMQKAFLPYYSTKAEGSGIGLSICREVVDAHHGQITLNNHPTGGLQVLIKLPIT